MMLSHSSQLTDVPRLSSAERDGCEIGLVDHQACESVPAASRAPVLD